MADDPKLLFNLGGKSRESFHAGLAQGGYLNSRGPFHSKRGIAVKGRGRKLGSGGGGQGGCWGLRLGGGRAGMQGQGQQRSSARL